MIDNDALTKLPMFATKQQIAVGIVGKDRASSAEDSLADPSQVPPQRRAHGGWLVPLMKKFYDRYLGIVNDFALKGAREEENWNANQRPRFGEEATATKTNAGPTTLGEIQATYGRREKCLLKKEERARRKAAEIRGGSGVTRGVGTVSDEGFA